MSSDGAKDCNDAMETRLSGSAFQILAAAAGKARLPSADRTKMVNGSRYYRALESVSISALSTALTIYPCQIRVHQR